MERYNFTNPLFLFKIEFDMRHLYIFIFFLVIVGCDDGDILTIELEFDKELERCENDNASYLIYDTKEDPNESLSLIIPRTEISELLFTIPTPVGTPIVFDIDGTAVRFNYRTYNRAVVTDELCDVIQPAGLTIVEDYEATTGTVEVTVTIDDDDGDGISSEDEGRDPNGDGDFSDAINTDASSPTPDDIPDYLDEDDDNDNVKTKDELDDDNTDGDDDPTTNPLDTDGDGVADYLDDDDDGDGVLTILEDEDGDQNPLNDLGNNADDALVPHFRNTLEFTPYDSPGLIDISENAYTRTVTTRFLVKGIDLEILRATEVDFGILTTTLSDFIPPEED